VDIAQLNHAVAEASTVYVSGYGRWRKHIICVVSVCGKNATLLKALKMLEHFDGVH
jgi:hypothetical protein